MAGDTDLWFHLDYGRYIFENGFYTYPTYFSYIEPPVIRYGSNCWLFQALIYKIYHFFDYHGLIALRAIVYLATASLVMIFLFSNSKRVNKSYPLLLIVSTLYFMFLMPRFHLIRPHMFDYMFIAAFIYLLESRDKRMLFLPVIAILWSNLHAIVFIIPLIIILSYIIEFFFKQIKNREHIKKDGLPFIIPAVISMGAVFITPFAYQQITELSRGLFEKSFITLYTLEFMKVRHEDILSLHVLTMSPTHSTVFSIIFFGAVISFMTALLKKNMRISHLLMFAGGVVLLTRGNRFMYEFALLSLPMIRNAVSGEVSALQKRQFTIPKIIIAGVLMLIPFIYLDRFFENPPRYPFSTKNLPHGVAAFLKKVDASGNILNHPNEGGYLRWMLYPDYKIFVDMEFPGFFNDEDAFVALNIFYDREVLKKFMQKYDPPFIIVPGRITGFKELIKEYPDYLMVFFDDTAVLYVNRNDYPEIAERYALKAIDPFTLIGTDLNRMNDEDIDSFLRELKRINGTVPDISLVNQTIGMILNKRGNHKEALKYAENIIINHPEMPKGYRLKADIYMLKEEYEEAIKYIEMAIERSEEADRYDLYRKLWVCYSKLEKPAKAYKALSKVVNIYSPETSYIDLFNLGILSLSDGRIDEALMLFKFAKLKVPPEDKEWVGKIDEQLSKFIVTDKSLKRISLE